MYSDDPHEAADWLTSRARAIEPVATAKVLAAAQATGGSVERLESRFKTRESIFEKLARFKQRKSPFYQLAKFNDALRYTVVYEDATYWESADLLREQFNTGDFAVIVDAVEWGAAYKGLNWTVQSASGATFEVQVHTPASLAAAEATHDLYKQQRVLRRSSTQARALQAEQARVWRTVPIPPAGR
jgi:ppGpp synthetase/RelA/SpoT-type nucleotidyltranferase